MESSGQNSSVDHDKSPTTLLSEELKSRSSSRTNPSSERSSGSTISSTTTESLTSPFSPKRERLLNLTPKKAYRTNDPEFYKQREKKDNTDSFVDLILRADEVWVKLGHAGHQYSSQAPMYYFHLSPEDFKTSLNWSRGLRMPYLSAVGKTFVASTMNDRHYREVSRRKEISIMAPPKELAEAHLLKFWDELTSAEKRTFLLDLESAKIEEINENYKQYSTNDIHSQGCIFTTPTTVTWADQKTHTGSSDEVCMVTRLKDVKKDIIEFWHTRGLELISQGKVGAVVMAGGQGTRLGWHEPKGTFPIGPVSGKSLFQIFCERHTSVRHLAQQKFSLPSLPSIALYIMTADHNYQQTIDFFKKNNFFGISENDIRFFEQQTIPCLGKDGKILLEGKGKISRCPNGNGGIFDSLRVAGMLDDMKKRGIEGIHVFGVDNALIKVLDPTFLGYVDACKAPVGNKCVMKVNPYEKVGMMCKKTTAKTSTDSKLYSSSAVVEYSDLPSDMRNKHIDDDPNKPLAFSAGNICNHYFRLDFIEDLLNLSGVKHAFFPHSAYKSIPHIDIETGQLISPKSINGIKFEYFIFDSFPLASRVAGLEVSRESDFSPVKNASGEDSPASCRDMLTNLYKSWLKENGWSIEGDGHLEISPLVSYESEGLQKKATITLPCYISELT